MDADVQRMRVAHARATFEAVVKVGEDLLGRAQRLAPIEEGTLRGSAELAIVVNGRRIAGAGAIAAARGAVIAAASSGDLRTIEAEVAFTEVYAARQHEELDWIHPLGGQAKYLEQPLNEQAERYGRIIQAAGDQAVDRLGR